eukprot:1061565-Rhodomonas_salina.3
MGLPGHFTNMYIEATDPMYAVSEYYDSNRNLVSHAPFESKLSRNLRFHFVPEMQLLEMKIF